MADQVGKCDMNNTLLWQNDAFSVNDIKKEECQDDNFVEIKVQVSETAIITEVKDNLKCDEAKLSLPKVESDVFHHDPIKIEGGSSADDTKCEPLNNGLLYCEDCQVYCEDYCAEYEMLVHILNRTVPIDADSTSQVDLPNSNILEIQDYHGESHIFALKAIPAGVKFGPFAGLSRTGRSWKIKGGKFVINKDKSMYLNWMQYISPARDISEQNLQVFQYEDNLYYRSTCLIEEGDELLVYFGEEYEDSLNRNVEMDFSPTIEHIFKDAFACTFCCLGFSSKSYLVRHKAICPGNADGFSVEELTQCSFCKIHLDQKEYRLHHLDYCWKINDRKRILSATGGQSTQVPEREVQQQQICECQQYKYGTETEGVLKDHTNKHYEAKTNKCGICCGRYQTREVQRSHAKNTKVCAGGKDDLERSIGVCVTEHSKTEHSRSPSETKQFKCPMCEFQTKYKLNLKAHMNTKHLNEFNYKCETCDYRTNWKAHLKEHIEAKHLKEFKHKCDICDYKTHRKINLKTHIETMHLRELRYKCDSCDYKANQKPTLKKHVMRKHSKEFKYKCEACDYGTNWPAYLKEHTEAKHAKDFKYKCDSCAYKTYRKDQFERHVEAKHLKEFKYKCDRCDYKTNRKSNLKTHTDARHLKEFKYKCDSCDYGTNWPAYLKKHIEAKHAKDFKYKCDSCAYKTYRKGQLERHVEAKHLKEFKYKCDMCNYKANVKYVLKIHIETKHLKEFKHKCDTCDYKTNVVSNLKKHLKSNHL